MIFHGFRPIRELFNSDEEYEKAAKDWDDVSNDYFNHMMTIAVILILSVIVVFIYAFGIVNFFMYGGAICLVYFAVYKAVKLSTSHLEGK